MHEAGHQLRLASTGSRFFLKTCQRITTKCRQDKVNDRLEVLPAGHLECSVVIQGGVAVQVGGCGWEGLRDGIEVDFSAW